MSEFWHHFRAALRPRASLSGAAIGAVTLVVLKWLEPVPDARGPFQATRGIRYQATRFTDWMASPEISTWIEACVAGALIGALLALLLAKAFEWLGEGWDYGDLNGDADDFPTRSSFWPSNPMRLLFCQVGGEARSIGGRLLGTKSTVKASTGQTPSDIQSEVDAAQPKSSRSKGIFLWLASTLVWAAIALVWMLWRSASHGYDVGATEFVVAGLVGTVYGALWPWTSAVSKSPSGFGTMRFREGRDQAQSMVNSLRPRHRLDPAIIPTDGSRFHWIPEPEAPDRKHDRDFWRDVKDEANQHPDSGPAWEDLDLVNESRRDAGLAALNVMLMVAFVDGAVEEPEAVAAVDTALEIGDGWLSPLDAVAAVDDWASGRIARPDTRSAEEELVKTALGKLTVADTKLALAGCAKVCASAGGINDREKSLLTRVGEWLGLGIDDVKSALYAVHRIAERTGGAGKGVIRSARSARPRTSDGSVALAPSLERMTRRQAWLLAGVTEEYAGEAATRKAPVGLATTLLTPRIQRWHVATEAMRSPSSSPVALAVAERKLGELSAAATVLGVHPGSHTPE